MHNFLDLDGRKTITNNDFRQVIKNVEICSDFTILSRCEFYTKLIIPVTDSLKDF